MHNSGNKLTNEQIEQLELDRAYEEGCMKIPMSDKETQGREIALGKCVPCGGMPINGLEKPIQGALTLGDKIEEIAKHVDSLNSIVREINSRLFRQEPNDCGVSPSNPNCIDEYLHLVSDGIDEANTMLTNIVNKL